MPCCGRCLTMLEHSELSCCSGCLKTCAACGANVAASEYDEATERCLDCNCSLRPDEVACISCGSPRKPSAKKPSMMVRFAKGVQILFIISCVITVASLFLPATPSFLKCLATTVILLFVNRSAEQMAEKQKS